MVISTCSEFKLSEQFLLEEEYNRQIYLSNPDIDWHLPWSIEQYTHTFFDREDSPYNNDPEKKMLHLDSDFISDSFLDNYNTNIYAMIPPNYFPVFIHRHTYFELTYVLSGSCINYSGNQKLILTEGDLMIMAPHTYHGLGVFSDDCRIINVMIRKETFNNSFFLEHEDTGNILFSFFTEVLLKYKINTYILFNIAGDNMIPAILISLLEKTTDYRSYQEKTKVSCLNTIFDRIIDKYAASARVYGDNNTDTKNNIAYILTYMQQNFHNISLHDLAVFFGYSDRQMNRIILKNTGDTYRENILKIKMRKAQQMLSNSNMPIEQISIELGFATCYAFRKFFKSRFNMTPSEYRKSLIINT